MKWVTFEQGDTTNVGVVVDGEVFATPGDETLLDLIQAGPEALEAAAVAALATEAAMSFGNAALCSPLEPPTVRDFLCFLDHYRNATLNQDLDPVWDQQPAFYFSNPYAVFGPKDAIEVSPGTNNFDFELEVGAVVGRDGANLHPDEAHEYIAGYLIFCDWSARDIQFAEMALGLGPVKAKDGATTLGPMFVTADELDPHRSGKGFDLAMRAWINDDLVTDGSLAQLDWSFAEMVAYSSRGTWVRAGDVIGSGTVPKGCLLEHAMSDGEDFRGWLKPGDRLRLEVDLLGSMELTVTEPPVVHPTRQTGSELS